MSSNFDRSGAGSEPAPKALGWRVLDVVVALWCLFVGIIFYGGYLDPVDIGVQTGNATMGYIAMIALAVVAVGLRYLRDREGRSRGASAAGPSQGRGPVDNTPGRSGDTGFDR